MIITLNIILYELKRNVQQKNFVLSIIFVTPIIQFRYLNSYCTNATFVQYKSCLTYCRRRKEKQDTAMVHLISDHYMLSMLIQLRLMYKIFRKIVSYHYQRLISYANCRQVGNLQLRYSAGDFSSFLDSHFSSFSSYLHSLRSLYNVHTTKVMILGGPVESNDVIIYMELLMVLLLFNCLIKISLFSNTHQYVIGRTIDFQLLSKFGDFDLIFRELPVNFPALDRPRNHLLYLIRLSHVMELRNFDAST